MFRSDQDHPSIKARALLVNLKAEEADGQTARELFDAMGIQWIAVGNEGLDKTVAQNLGSADLPEGDPERMQIREDPPAGTVVPDGTKLLVMAAFTRDEVEKFLEDYRQSEAPPIRLKAIATHNNIHWRVRSLAEELEREHQMMSLFTALARAVQAVETMDPADYTESSWEPLAIEAKLAAQHVEKIRQQTDVPIPDLRRNWQALQSALNELIPETNNDIE